MTDEQRSVLPGRPAWCESIEAREYGREFVRVIGQVKVANDAYDVALVQAEYFDVTADSVIVRREAPQLLLADQRHDLDQAGELARMVQAALELVRDDGDPT